MDSNSFQFHSQMTNKMKVTKKRQKEFLKDKLSSNSKWALKALLTIYKNQTDEEQEVGHTYYNNGIGFSGVDSQILSSFAEQYLNKGYLSNKQMSILFKNIPKYWSQVLEVSDQEKLNQIILQ